ncbi:KpsF/GutQ family sugar-phosphate isomerase [Methylonatrum kenyense]|uniref:KpsF/GutQ family sugar-phosphate isomerase n=1 Tax=Methylonatrum kenyense TaxID=455253 RepID=UPI003D111C97
MSAIETAKEVFAEQATALRTTGEAVGVEFEQAVSMILNGKGRVIVSGMGKSGIIGQKIAATLASTGTPSFSVHPAEAYHGDLGMITNQDLAILISYSGETEEVIRLIPSLRHFGTSIIALVGNKESTLAKNADVVLDVSVQREVCPNNLAPTTSTTVALAMGDALAVALINRRDFKPDDFAVFHPGGSLGRRLLTTVNDVMHRDLPTNSPRDSIRDVIVEMTKGGLGTSVVVEKGRLQGIITDGDLRRSLFSHDEINDLCAKDIMTPEPMTVCGKTKFAEAEMIMLDQKITSLVVVDEEYRPQGILKLHDAVLVG